MILESRNGKRGPGPRLMSPRMGEARHLTEAVQPHGLRLRVGEVLMAEGSAGAALYFANVNCASSAVR